MSVLAEYNTRPEDVGDILLKVHEDLQHLKDKLLSSNNENDIDLSALESAITKTEDGIKTKAEQVLSHINNRVQTMPSLEAQSQQPNEADEALVMIETTWDMRAKTGGHYAVRRSDYRSMGLLETREMGSHPAPPALPPATIGKVQTAGYTPGQQHKINWTNQVAANPHNDQNRQVMSESYSIQLPLIQSRQPQKPQGTVVKGSTFEPLAMLPAANRKDASLAPPPISEDDASYGILSLLERGLIPPAAHLTLDPSPVGSKLIPLHSIEDKFKPPAINDSPSLAGVKLDTNVKITSSTSTMQKNAKKAQKERETGILSRKSAGKAVTRKTFQMPMQQPYPPPTTPATGDLIDRNFSHRFPIQHGKIRDQIPDFLSFKQHYCLHWGSIVTMLKQFEKLLTNYAIPVAFIDGDRLADLSLEYEIERGAPVQAILTAIVNREDVEALLYRPGRRYLGPNGRELAATKVQATWKCYRDRKVYLEFRQRKWAAGVIAITWIMHVKMAMVKKQLKQRRKDELLAYKERAKTFALQWNRIKNSKRVIIHIPSLGHSQNLRENIHDMGIRQNTQMSRLCDIRDPNVDVIYISPVSVNDETLQYYSKLLGLKAAIDTGVVEDQLDVTERFKIIVPEAIHSFPTHRMCLATHLKYSTRALKRIKNLIKGRDAFIVTGVPHVDDLSVSDILKVPLYAPEPDVAHLYSTKSGSKRVFASANVQVPFGEYDIYNLTQMYESFAQLITDHLDVKVWLFKQDDEFDGKGIAYLDVGKHLKCYKWALKECRRYGEKWSRKWAQEPVFIKVYSEIPDILEKYAQPIHKADYTDWETFLRHFLSLGGIIEATPPSDSITCLSANMLIEPNGKLNILGVSDQLHADSPYKCWGLSFPQSSVEPEDINSACLNISQACKSRGVVGYFVIDFVTFIDPHTDEQVIWATDLNLCYDDSHAMLQLNKFITNGILDISTHMFDIPPPKQDKRKRRRKKNQEEEELTVGCQDSGKCKVCNIQLESAKHSYSPISISPSFLSTHSCLLLKDKPPNTNRYTVFSSKLLHTNLAIVHYSVFFQMCRAHGIGFDVKEKQGSVFTLIDSSKRENLGMLSIADNLQGALATFARNLSVIHQEISAPNMQGQTNFKLVIQDIEAILGTTIQNAEEQEIDIDNN